jgi:hypothetical protein
MSTNNSSSPFDFPIDILRCIIEFAVWNDTETAQTLELVNHAFRIWAGPAAYRTVLLHSPSTLIGFSELFRAAPGPSSTHATTITRDTDFYAKNVQYLGIFKPKVPESVLEPIFLICTGVVTLELQNVAFKRSQACAMRPRQFILPAFTGSPLEPSLFENVTHLWINSADLYVKGVPPQIKCIAVLRSIDITPSYNWLANILSLPELKMLVFNLFSASRSIQFSPRIYWSTYLSGVRDERIVIRNSFMRSSESESRLALCRGVSVWELALHDGERHPAFFDSKPTSEMYL